MVGYLMLAHSDQARRRTHTQQTYRTTEDAPEINKSREGWGTRKHSRRDGGNLDVLAPDAKASITTDRNDDLYEQ